MQFRSKWPFHLEWLSNEKHTLPGRGRRAPVRGEPCSSSREKAAWLGLLIKAAGGGGKEQSIPDECKIAFSSVCLLKVFFLGPTLSSATRVGKMPRGASVIGWCRKGTTDMERGQRKRHLIAVVITGIVSRNKTGDLLSPGKYSTFINLMAPGANSPSLRVRCF